MYVGARGGRRPSGSNRGGSDARVELEKRRFAGGGEGRVEPEEAPYLVHGGRYGVRRPARGNAAGRNERRAVDSGGPVGERTRSDHGLLESPEDTIRIISARRATSHERKRYEEGGW